MPGRYMVKIHVRESAEPDFHVGGFSTVVSIGQKIDESEVSFMCPELVEPGDSLACNITVYGGQDMNLQIDYGDDSGPIIFNTSGESLA